MPDTAINARITPAGSLELLSQKEVNQLGDKGASGLYDLFRLCSLAVLNSGNDNDDGKAILEAHRQFDIRLVQQNRGIKLELINAPATAFVDGVMIKGIKEHLFAVVRDILYINNEMHDTRQFDLSHGEDITNFIFHHLRQARVLHPDSERHLAVCWGGHSISRDEYDYTKVVGYELGLRGLNVCTGCGPGAMKGPMKGATIAHAKQRISDGRYLGITEPGIIAAEAPNAIVNELVIMPDIEKRLEAFVRMAHGIIVFPGGVGTTEEILYLLGILLDPANADIPFPIILTGPPGSEAYFDLVDGFIRDNLGEAASRRYRVIIGDASEVARQLAQGAEQVRQFRRARSDAYYFNWSLKINSEFQQPFHPTHENMAQLALHSEQPLHKLAAALRRAFSGIVAGNVKADGIEAIERRGPFQIHGEAAIMQRLDALLQAFAGQQRMKLPGSHYEPCYRLV